MVLLSENRSAGEDLTFLTFVHSKVVYNGFQKQVQNQEIIWLMTSNGVRKLSFSHTYKVTFWLKSHAVTHHGAGGMRKGLMIHLAATAADTAPLLVVVVVGRPVFSTTRAILIRGRSCVVRPVLDEVGPFPAAAASRAISSS